MIHLGFDIGGTNIKAGLVSCEGRLLMKSTRPFPKQDDSACVALMETMAAQLLKEADLSLSDVADIGVAVPGSIDPAGEVVLHAYNLGFHNVHLKAAVSRLYPDIPVTMANDANAAALAELYGGAFSGKKTALLLTLGTGVGAGLILGGKMFNGGRGNGVEIGHMTLDYRGAQCSCGSRGCLETLCSAAWLVQQGRREAQANPRGAIAGCVSGRMESISAKTVADCARMGDAKAAAIFDQYVEYLSQGIASIANILDPEVIALGGGVSLAGDILYPPLRQKVKEKVFFKCEYQIVPAVWGNDAGIIGAAMLLGNSKK